MKMNPVVRAIGATSVALVFALFSVMAIGRPVYAAAPEGAGTTATMSEVTGTPHGSLSGLGLTKAEMKMLHKALMLHGGDVKIEVDRDGLDREFKIEVKIDADDDLFVHPTVDFKREIKVDAEDGLLLHPTIDFKKEVKVDADEGLFPTIERKIELKKDFEDGILPSVERKIEVKKDFEDGVLPSVERKVELKKDFEDGVLPTVERKIEVKVDAGEGVLPIAPKLHGIDKAAPVAPAVAPRIDDAAACCAPGAAVAPTTEGHQTPGAAPLAPAMAPSTSGPSMSGEAVAPMIAPKAGELEKGIAPMVAPRTETGCVDCLAPAVAPRIEREGDLKVHGIAPRLDREIELERLGLDNSGPGNAEDRFGIELDDDDDVRFAPRLFPRGEFGREFEFERD
jgi:hypothetical protein